MSREAEITQFSFGKEAEEHRTSMVFYGEAWGEKKVADSVLAFPLKLFSGLMDLSYHYELKWHHFSGILR